MKRLERWLAYFSNKLNETETEALAMSEAAIQEAMKAEYVFMQDEIERWQYEQREKAIRDYISGMRAWRREGLKQGIEQGIKQGIEQGVMQASLQNIKNLMENMNLSATQAMDVLQIPASEREKYTNLLHS
ncbi:Rpn family recombination-promoting nuclease/putative transposase [Selenomonas massiliensis]|uniref:Rpn family recombination-promoting nuclease/putative transposase n=1 Tax=Selenomonas massiliensis TaxID=2058293 RepID=UPI001F375614